MIIFAKKRIGYYGIQCLIVYDHAAGSNNRYTVYVIPASPSRKIRIIGRELTLGVAKKIAQQAIDKNNWILAKRSLSPR